jgi:hypothetical protein
MDSQLDYFPSRFSDRVLRLLERVEYRLAESAEDKDAIFRMRYEAYLRENAIEPRASGRFSDPFDEAWNVRLIGMFIDGELASSIRIHVATSVEDPLPGKAVFPEAVLPRLRQGLVVVDPTRFVTHLEFSRRFHEMPYLTVRPGWMAGEYFNADFILATCRTEHQAYYRRVFGHEVWCPAKDYPTLKKPLACMGLDRRAAKERVLQRYPFYNSAEAEREALLGRPSTPIGAAKCDVNAWSFSASAAA